MLNNNSVVIGLGFGDEGKGITTDYLCSQSLNPLVVRFSGGHQAGHNVVYKGKQHIFSNFGSGTLRGIPTYWSKYSTIDPIGIINEMHVLADQGVPRPQLFIDPDSPVTTPYDKFYNKSSEKGKKHGSCGVGFGATIEREIKHYSLTFGDLFSKEIRDIKLKMIRDFYYGPKYFAMDSKSSEAIRVYHKNIEEAVKEFKDRCDEIISLSFIEQKTFKEIQEQNFYSNFIFEGSQGILLDTNHGFFPHVSWSNCGSTNPVEMIGKDLDYYLVTRAYQTRHGHGPMPYESFKHNIPPNPDEKNITGKWQGEFRLAILDADLLVYAMRKDENVREAKGRNHLVITCLDHIKNNWNFMYLGVLNVCHSENEFVAKLGAILHISTPNIILSHSPDSKNFKYPFNEKEN